MSAPQRFVDYLTTDQYHPRSSKHGNKLNELLLRDLLDTCDAFRTAAKSGKIVYKSNYSVGKGSPTSWNLDLVVGPPASSQKILTGELSEGDPSEIWIGIDQKTVMTEHGKARRNRGRDLDALQDTLHRKNPKTVVGALMVVNIADRFQSPLRKGEVTTHKNIERLVKETIDIYRGLPRSSAGGVGLEALGVIVVSHTNLKDKSKVAVDDPAPQPGDALHYGTFLEDICQAFRTRFTV